MGCKSFRQLSDQSVSGNLSACRLSREIMKLGYEGGQSAMEVHFRDIRPVALCRFERKFERKPGEQAQTEFKTNFVDKFGIAQKIHLISLVFSNHR